MTMIKENRSRLQSSSNGETTSSTNSTLTTQTSPNKSTSSTTSCKWWRSRCPNRWASRCSVSHQRWLEASNRSRSQSRMTSPSMLGSTLLMRARAQKWKRRCSIRRDIQGTKLQTCRKNICRKITPWKMRIHTLKIMSQSQLTPRQSKIWRHSRLFAISSLSEPQPSVQVATFLS